MTVVMESEAMTGARRDDDHGGSLELGLRRLEVGDHGTRCDVHALAQARVTMTADLPQILAAARLNVFDVQRISRPNCSRCFAVQRIDWNLAPDRPVHTVLRLTTGRPMYQFHPPHTT